MENEQMKPTYEELVTMYNELLLKYNQLQFDKTNEKIQMLMGAFKMASNGNYEQPESVRNLAEYHLKNFLAKPKKK